MSLRKKNLKWCHFRSTSCNSERCYDSIQMMHGSEWVRVSVRVRVRVFNLKAHYTDDARQWLDIEICSQELTSLLLASKIVSRKVDCVIEKERRTHVIRCYKWQHFGHLARFCNNKRRCEFCAGSHQSDELCIHKVLRVNCSGNHPSFSSKCPAYIAGYEMLTKQYSECEHFLTITSDVALLQEIWHCQDRSYIGRPNLGA